MEQQRETGKIKGIAVASLKPTQRKRDWVAGGLACIAICLFVALAASVIPTTIRAWQGHSGSPDAVLANALILNVALILLGWQRFKSLNEELDSRRKFEEEAWRLAAHDDLTGCLNRRSFSEELAAMLDEAHSTGRAVGVIAVDLDNFKQVNDINGHAAGDVVLSETAHRIRSLLPDNALIARLGGDEFVCAMPYHGDHPEKIELLATRVAEQVSRPVPFGETMLDVTLSLGISSSVDIADKDIENPAQKMMHKADIAMYHAKKQGKNRYYWFEASMENELKFRSDLESGIRRGIANGEFIPYYEQQIDLDSGEIVGFEMLARWDSPEMGLIPPDIFIPIAEEIGVIAELSESLIEQAFVDARAWSPELTLSVNISPVQMRDPWFAQRILKLLVKHRFPPDRLDIEITETCLHENIGMVRTMITSLRNQGVRVSLDDFGTGYASLSQLRTLPFDRLKIDRSFISEIGSTGHNKLIEAIVSIGDGLKIPITAEGIENDDILGALKKWGQMKGQGYHYGRPEPASLVLERLQTAGKLAPETDDTVVRIGPAGDEATQKRKADGS